MKFTVEYDSNNSGGHWWLKDENWEQLRKAGWEPEGRELVFGNSPDGRWLGALYHSATITITARTPKQALRAAIQSWEAATSMDASDEGCNCCGPPHTFKIENPVDKDWDWEDTYISGDQIAYLMTNTKPGVTLREALEKK